MSTTSSQMPVQDGQSNQMQPHMVKKKSNSSSFLYSEDNLREETILEKEIVKITPPLYVDSKRLLFEKRIRNGYANSADKFIICAFFCIFFLFCILQCIINVSCAGHSQMSGCRTVVCGSRVPLRTIITGYLVYFSCYFLI